GDGVGNGRIPGATRRGVRRRRTGFDDRPARHLRRRRQRRRALPMRQTGGERGIALLMVIWIFMVLSVLSAEFSRGMRDDAIATQNLAEEIQARGVAIAGVNRAIYRMMH